MIFTGFLPRKRRVASFYPKNLYRSYPLFEKPYQNNEGRINIIYIYLKKLPVRGNVENLTFFSNKMVIEYKWT